MKNVFKMEEKIILLFMLIYFVTAVHNFEQTLQK